MTPAEMVEELEEGIEEDIRELARTHDKAAIQTLATAMDESTESSWAVKIKAAKDLIEFGHDRAAVRDPGERSNSLTIIVNQLSTGTATEHVIDGVQTAKEVAQALEATGETPQMEIPDANHTDMPSVVPAGVPGTGD